MGAPLTLSGLDGRNPMAYFAAIGVLLAAGRVRPETRPRLAWADEPLPRPLLHTALNRDELVGALDEDRRAWAGAPALQGTRKSSDDIKFGLADQREYLFTCRSADDGGRSALLGAALVAEASMAGMKKNEGKPTDLHFTAGRQRFLTIARRLQRDVTSVHLQEALWGPWRYDQRLPTFKWDVTDDRVYALSASEPSSTKKKTVPGADWLALMGLSAFPVIREPGRSAPPCVAGTWKRGLFRWGLWSEPLTDDAVRTLIASQWPTDQVPLFRTGVFRVMTAHIRRRSDSGGCGSFSPASVLWEGPLASEGKGWHD